ncbi:LCP family protein [Paenibacillus thailandensis]|uniref:LCP family protein n=1 Tax=Paenibacillus thailandensis TaxID=393250 RepID=A0ABW5QSK9_9BACL
MSMRLKYALVGSAAGLALLAAAAVVYGWHIYSSVRDTAAEVYEPIAPREYVSRDPEVSNGGGVEPAAIGGKHPFSVVVMGVDEREGDRGRSDTIIVLAVNPDKNSILMFNIPRDTRTEIVGHGTTDKINHAYAFGGAEMSKSTIETFLDYPIDYYVTINMEGFAKLIDLLGGVEVNNPFAFDYSGITFNEGPLKLNGEEALLYSRMRYEDPRGDLGRNGRQRDVLVQVMKRTLSFTSILQVQKLLDQLGSSVRTNITFDEMKRFMAEYRSGLKRIETVEIGGRGQTIGGVWYYIVPDEERNRIHDLLKEQLQ